MPTIVKVGQQQMALYRATAKRRWEQEQPELARRRERAWQVARHAASMLRDRFGATRVVAFGSLVHPNCFTRWSDVDIAAWGIRPQDTFRAIGTALDTDSELEVNLVDVGAYRPEVLAAIEQGGVDL